EELSQIAAGVAGGNPVLEAAEAKSRSGRTLRRPRVFNLSDDDGDDNNKTSDAVFTVGSIDFAKAKGTQTWSAAAG
ncbi:unnamed protein product, partial [Notodromas monacha]